MSNPVFIITSLSESDQEDGKFSNIILRFFESQAANDFELESTIFQTASEAGLTAKIIETDCKTYRVE